MRALIDDLYYKVVAALVQFTSATLLYALTVGAGGLLIEAFVADDLMQGIGARNVIKASTSAHIDLGALLGQPASPEISPVDGSRTSFAGEISDCALLGSEGGLAQDRVRIDHWI